MKSTFMSLRVWTISDGVLNVSDSDELGRRQAAEVVALPRQVGLIGIARLGGRLGQGVAVVLDEVEEVAESENAPEHLRAVADGALEAAPQLALADVESLAEVTHTGRRRLGGDQFDSGGNVRVRGVGVVESGQQGGFEYRLFGLHGGSGGQVGGEPPRMGSPDALERDAAVGELLGVGAEEARRSPAAEADAYRQRALGQADDISRRVRAGDREGLVADPDDVDAAVGKDAHAGVSSAGP